ncbi:nascent polypeptide-associated complex protein [Candidatus Pacearchaeota archaeon]|nr:nascent polypeptide-associated complex protein [Candidatus Pacearchaeota archaeon]MBD3283802.1 nascent polypeptide-associated complex protein [Candidatus Pacearchaeota archaeon]
MIPGLNPKKMNALMKQMGISQEEIPSKRVIIESDNKNIIITNPSVMKINMQGQENFQISGDIAEEDKQEDNHTEEDIKTIMEKTECSEEQAKEALQKSEGDLTDAILSLS